MALTKEQSLREAIAHEEAQLAEPARMFERRLRGYRAIGYSAEEVTSDL